jgi:hypothetical protein
MIPTRWVTVPVVVVQRPGSNVRLKMQNVTFVWLSVCDSMAPAHTPVPPTTVAVGEAAGGPVGQVFSSIWKVVLVVPQVWSG